MNTTKQMHTRTPWQLCPGQFNVIKGANGEGIAWYTTGDDGVHYKDEDAAFIVRAVNSHEKLVEALDWFRDNLTLIHEGWSDIYVQAQTKLKEAGDA